jgi:hypothetical protein
VDNTTTMKVVFTFLMFFLTVAINLDDNVLARLGFERDYLVMTLVTLVVTGLIAHRRLLLIVLVLFLSIGANMPAAFMLNFGIDRDFLVGVLCAIVLLPVLVRVMNWL